MTGITLATSVVSAYHTRMSEDPTKDLGQKYDTQPTVKTVVQMLGEMREEMRTVRGDARRV